MDSPKFVDRLVKEVLGERERILAALNQMPAVTAYPSAANFLMFRSAKAAKIYKGLVKQGILIRDVSDGKRLNNCLRVTVGTPQENRKFLREIKKLV